MPSETAIVSQPIDLPRLLAAVADPGAGATAIFVGTVRTVHDGRAVRGIEYHAYGGMAERELRAIVDETVRLFGTCGVAVHHRIGYLAPGEASIVIAASHARRAAACDATRHVIEEVKRRVPIWKREHYEDGTRHWVDPTRSPREPEALAGRDAVSTVP